MSAFNDYFLDTLKNRYADFDGRARRSEYWYFVLFYILLAIGIGLISGLLASVAPGLEMVGSILIGVMVLAMFIPNLAVSVRRLHDTDKSGWMILIGLIPIIGSIALIVFYCMDGTPGSNQYGPNPKNAGGGSQDLDILDSTLRSEDA